MLQRPTRVRLNELNDTTTSQLPQPPTRYSATAIISPSPVAAAATSTGLFPIHRFDNPGSVAPVGSPSTRQLNYYPSTPNFLREQAALAAAAGPQSLHSPGRVRAKNLWSWQTIKNKFGVKSTIAFALIAILVLLIWRHERPVPIRKPPVIIRTDTILSSTKTHTEDGHEHAHDSTLPHHEHAATGPAESQTPAVPVVPPHVHPPAYVWEHESAVEERRPPNFALNGEYPQYNEEKLTSIFQKPHVAGLETPGLVTSFVSPTGRLKVSVLMSEEGRLGYMLEVARPEYIPPPNKDVKEGIASNFLPLLSPAFLELNANYQACTWNTGNSFGAEVMWQLEFGESYWRPVPGNERRHFHETYQQVKVWCSGKQCRGCEFVWEIRLYDYALAIRAVVDGKSIESFATQPQSDAEAEYAHLDWGMEVRLPTDANSLCWAQNSEEPYVRRTCADIPEPVMTPITIQLDSMGPGQLPPHTKPSPLPFRFLSILQADGPAFMRSTGQTSTENPHALDIVTKGELPIHAQEYQLGVIDHPILGHSTPTSWNVILVGETPADLVHRNSIIYLLCPPPMGERFPMAQDGRWVSLGKSLRVRGHSTEKSKFMIDFAAMHNYQLIHFDAGWYGDENKESSNPRKVAPEFNHELDIVEVTKYGKSRGVGVSVYVNEIALKDTLDLIEVYPRWKLNGIKFGFVDVGSPRAMRVLHERLIAFQHVGLMVNIHDLYRPRGLSRTWPHLITQEGVRGEERKPDATHHTILPFVRYVQGSADYTPRYLRGALRCTRAHQLALPFILFSPIQSLFWAEPGQAIAEAVQLYLPELVVWQLMTTVWDDTRVLTGEIGQYVSIGRRTGLDWFVGTITNTQEREVYLNLSTLFDHTFDNMVHPLPLYEQSPPNTKGYMVYLYEDDYEHKVDTTVDTNLNNIRVKLRQSFILPPQWSSAIHQATKAQVLAVPTSAGTFPHDPLPTHLNHLQEYRRKITFAQDKQLGAMYMKETGKGIPVPQPLESPIIKIKMAPSGGSVMYITPML